MGISQKADQRLLLFYCSFTCIYFPGILILLKYKNNLYNIGTYKFIPVLLVLVFAEVVKLSFSLINPEPPLIGRVESRTIPKFKKAWTKFLKDVFKFVFSMLVLSSIYYIIIILFGAPLLSQHEETTMLTLTLSTLTFVPASLHLGVDTALSILSGTHFPKGDVLINAVKTNIKITLLGTWLGAIVIPLDWDRPWQAWPIPCVMGALIGYTAAHCFTLVKVLPFSKLHKKVHK